MTVFKIRKVYRRIYDRMFLRRKLVKSVGNQLTIILVFYVVFDKIGFIKENMRLWEDLSSFKLEDDENNLPEVD